jgi:parallel beta helix pectate lyase-like protein
VGTHSSRALFAIAVGAFAVLPFAERAAAVDGVVGINQASITAAGGFPFSASSGAYRLTGNVTVPDGNTSAIGLGAGASLDLNGFTISGPAVCTSSSPYNPTTMTCTNSGSGTGIYAAGGGLIKNGRITGMGNVAISGGDLATPLQIENVQMDNNAQGGVNLYLGVVRNSAITNNGGPGVFDCYCGASGSENSVEGNVIAFNKGIGVNTGALILRNRISYNGGAGIEHGPNGGTHSRINDNFIYRNVGVGINAWGSYSNNSIYGNLNNPTQVIGGMADAGGNSTN